MCFPEHVRWKLIKYKYKEQILCLFESTVWIWFIYQQWCNQGDLNGILRGYLMDGSNGVIAFLQDE